MRKWNVSAALAAALAILACNGYAGDNTTGPYVGVSVGQGQYRDACRGAPFDCDERAEYEVFHNVGDRNITGRGDIHLWSAGLVWRF